MLANLLGLFLLAEVVTAKEDYYFRACNKLIMKKTAYADISGLSGEEMYEILHKNHDYQDSLGDCIQTCAGLTNSTDSKQTKIEEVSWGYFQYMCNYYHAAQGDEWSDIARRIAQDPVEETNDDTSLRVKIPESRLLQDNIIPAGLSFYRARYFPNAMGYGLIYYLLGIFGIQMFLNILGRVTPKLLSVILRWPVISDIRRYFTVPPLLGATASRVLQNYNQRLHYLWISGFIILNILFACLAYDGQELSPLYYADYTHLYSSAIGFRTGYLAMYMLPVVFLFGTRSNILIWMTGWNLDVFNLWHRWIGRLCFLQIVGHAAAYHIHYQKTHSVGEAWAETFWKWGFIALLLWGLMCLHGTKPLRALAYDLFVFFHVAFAAVSMVGVHVHLWYTNQCKEAWYVCIAIWGADHLFRLFRIAFNGSIVNAKVKTPTDDTIIIDIGSTHRLPYTPGAFVFVHFMHPLMFWQSHPFTYVPVGEKEKKLVFKPRKGLTKWAHKQASKGELKVLLDGPYVNTVNFQPFDTISFVAGGIGVTAVYAHLMSLSREELTARAVNFDWIIRSEESIKYFSDEIRVLKGLPIDLTIHVTTLSSNIETEKIEFQSTKSTEAKEEVNKDYTPPNCCDCDIKDDATITIKPHEKQANEPRLLQKIMLPPIAKCQKSLAYFVCGPSSLNREAREIIAEQIPASNKYIQIYDESFSM